MLKNEIVSTIYRARRSILEHASVVGLENTQESTFRSYFMEHLCTQNPEVQCEAEWKRVDLLIRAEKKNILIEFKYYLSRRSCKLDGSPANWKGGAGRRNKGEFDKCVIQLFQNQWQPIHEKYLILIYESSAPRGIPKSYSHYYDELQTDEMIDAVDRLDTCEGQELKAVLLTIGTSNRQFERI